MSKNQLLCQALMAHTVFVHALTNAIQCMFKDCKKPIDVMPIQQQFYLLYMYVYAISIVLVWYLFKVVNVRSGCPISQARGLCYKCMTI